MMNEAWLAGILLYKYKYKLLSFPSEDVTSRLYLLPPMNPIDVGCIDSRFKNPLLPFLLKKKKEKKPQLLFHQAKPCIFAPPT